MVKLLPSRQFGYIVLTTSAGIMDHEEARRKHVAGKIIGYGFSAHIVDDALMISLQFLLLERRHTVLHLATRSAAKERKA